MSYAFGERSRNVLHTADPRLVKLCNEVIEHIDFGVHEAYRTFERQRELYAQGKTHIDGVDNAGKHNILPSHAIDVHPYEKGHNPFDGSEKSELMFYRLYRAFERASRKLDIPIEWGGFWSFKDFPHIELKSA